MSALEYPCIALLCRGRLPYYLPSLSAAGSLLLAVGAILSALTGGEHLELFCCNSAQHTVLIQLFENRVQFSFPLPYGCRFLLLPADLPLKLGGLLAANVGGELFRMFPRRTRHPVQVLQYDLIQNVLPDVVACAGFSIFLVGAVGKVIVRLPALLCVIVRS